MTPSLAHIGAHASPVLVIDGFTGDAAAVARIAAALAPFPPARTLYPGLRRVISREDGAAWAYVERSVRAAAALVGRAFGYRELNLLEASFSLVTRPPADLAPLQRIPHFDSTDPGYLAILHFLAGTAGTGTAFYRQRATGIERVTTANHAAFVDTARRDADEATGYIAASDACFEQVAIVPAAPDRLVVYQGSLLHSGVITPDGCFSADPLEGRLTANLFVQGTGAAGTPRSSGR